MRPVRQNQGAAREALRRFRKSPISRMWQWLFLAGPVRYDRPAQVTSLAPAIREACGMGAWHAPGNRP